MRIFLFLIMAAGVMLAGCQKPFRKGQAGLEYKIISDGKGAELKQGKYMLMHIAQIYSTGKKDTILSDTRNAVPVIELFDSVMTPPEYYKILVQARKGDSIVIRMSTDTLFSRMPGGVPPYMKKGNFLLTTVKMVDILDTKEKADSARESEMEKARIASEKRAEDQLKKDDKILSDYLKKNNIKAAKAPEGTYVEIITPGEGPLIDTTVVVKTNYTGRLLDGKVFDSNVDSSFNHVEPFMVNMTGDRSLGGVIKGWTDGLKLLNKGAKARFYIPSPLAYGERGAGEDIPANACLIFDIEVLELQPAQQARFENEMKRKKFMDEQIRLSDSLEKAKKK